MKKNSILPFVICVTMFNVLVLISATGCNGTDPENTSGRPWAEPGGVPGFFGSGNDRRNR